MFLTQKWKERIENLEAEQKANAAARETLRNVISEINRLLKGEVCFGMCSGCNGHKLLISRTEKPQSMVFGSPFGALTRNYYCRSCTAELKEKSPQLEMLEVSKSEKTKTLLDLIAEALEEVFKE